MSESEIDYKMAKWDSALIGWLIDWLSFLTILLKVIFSSQKIDLSGRLSPSTCRAYNNNSTVGLKKKNQKLEIQKLTIRKMCSLDI